MKRRDMLAASISAAALAPLSKGAFAGTPCPPALMVDGVPGNAACSAPILDWQSRTAAPGVRLAENFSGYADTAALTAASVFDGVGRAATLVDSPAVLSSGKACQIQRLPGDGSAGEEWFMWLSGSSQIHYPRMYVQVVLYCDANDLDWPCLVSGGAGSVANPKIFIIDEMTGSPTQRNEIVVTNERTAGFITSYRTGNGTPFERGISTPYGADTAKQPAIDTGTPSNPTNVADWNRRYGKTASAGGVPSSGSRLSAQGLPYAPAVEAGGIWHPNDKTVIEVFFDHAANVYQLWAAKYGDAPQLIADFQGNFNWLGASASQHWDHIALLNYNTNGQSEVGIRPTMTRQYLEVISSTAPINFPMSIAPPGNLG